ncbi:hypothetical protein PSEUDO8AS_20125 [Pseudomonas sp. 8AS]|nr:hypothetical protein PSEUDO8AS_20125 [Pseudomonas sp. 8AS]
MSAGPLALRRLIAISRSTLPAATRQPDWLESVSSQERQQLTGDAHEYPRLARSTAEIRPGPAATEVRQLICRRPR